MRIPVNFTAVSMVLEFKILSSFSVASKFFSTALLVNTARSGKMALEMSVRFFRKTLYSGVLLPVAMVMTYIICMCLHLMRVIV